MLLVQGSKEQPPKPKLGNIVPGELSDHACLVRRGLLPGDRIDWLLVFIKNQTTQPPKPLLCKLEVQLRVGVLIPPDRNSWALTGDGRSRFSTPFLSMKTVPRPGSETDVG